MCGDTHHARSDMKAVIAVSCPDRWMLEFTQVIRWFDEQHEGCVFQVIGEHALPTDPLELRRTFDRRAPGFPVVDPRRFGFDRDCD